MKRRWALASLLLLPAAAGGQGLDMNHGGPVTVTSDNGMEWRQNEQVIIAKGNAMAVRGDVTVTADELIAHYRKKAAPPGQPAPAAPPAGAKPPAPGAADDSSNNEIYRLEAVGNVHIFNQSDQAFSDKAVYDVDQSVLVLTGGHLRIITPQDTMTARDDMEYWSQQHMAVGRGDAVVTTDDGRQIRADVLVGYTSPDQQQPANPVQKASAPATPPGKQQTDPLAQGSGKLKRVDAFGHVVVRTQAETFHGDKGVYVPDTGIARLVGNVHLTRGQNELNGDEAIINLKTGVSTMERHGNSRVQGLVVPNDAQAASAQPGGAAPAKASGSVKP